MTPTLSCQFLVKPKHDESLRVLSSMNEIDGKTLHIVQKEAVSLQKAVVCGFPPGVWTLSPVSVGQHLLVHVEEVQGRSRDQAGLLCSLREKSLNSLTLPLGGVLLSDRSFRSHLGAPGVSGGATTKSAARSVPGAGFTVMPTTLPSPAQEEGRNSCMLPQLWRQVPCLELGLPLEEGPSLQDAQPPAGQAEQQERGDEPGEEGKAAYSKEAAANPETSGEALWTAAPAQGAVAHREKKNTAGREGSEQKQRSGSGTTAVSP